MRFVIRGGRRLILRDVERGPTLFRITGTPPVITPPGLHHNLPGRYTFVVERFQGGVPVEVLARRFVQVES